MQVFAIAAQPERQASKDERHSSRWGSFASLAGWAVYSSAGVCAGLIQGSRYAMGEAVLGLMSSKWV